VKIGFCFPFLKAYGWEDINLAHDFYKVFILDRSEE